MQTPSASLLGDLTLHRFHVHEIAGIGLPPEHGTRPAYDSSIGGRWDDQREIHSGPDSTGAAAARGATAGLADDWNKCLSEVLNRSDRLTRTEPFAQYCIGLGYLRGHNVRQDYSESAVWLGKAAAQNQSGALAALGFGFRNEQEYRLVIGNQPRTAGELLGADPAGITFRSKQERIVWLAGLRKRVDRSEAITRWQLREREYDECSRTRGAGCIEPGPRPR